MSKILIYGGTFDPPHLAHVEVAHRAMEHLQFDRVLYIPARQTPLKDVASFTADHRLAMLELALCDSPWASISTVELDCEGTSYTIDTVETLQNNVDEFRLLIGADQWSQFQSWRRWEELIELANPVVMPREGFALDDERILPIQPLPSTSTEIRERIDQKKAFAHLVHPKVAAYIAQHNLCL